MVTDDAEAEKPMRTFDLDGALVGKAFTGGNGIDPRERPRRFLRHASVRKFNFGCHQKCCTIRYGIVRRIRL